MTASVCKTLIYAPTRWYLFHFLRFTPITCCCFSEAFRWAKYRVTVIMMNTVVLSFSCKPAIVTWNTDWTCSYRLAGCEAAVLRRHRESLCVMSPNATTLGTTHYQFGVHILINRFTSPNTAAGQERVHRVLLRLSSLGRHWTVYNWTHPRWVFMTRTVASISSIAQWSASMTSRHRCSDVGMDMCTHISRQSNCWRCCVQQTQTSSSSILQPWSNMESCASAAALWCLALTTATEGLPVGQPPGFQPHEIHFALNRTA